MNSIGENIRRIREAKGMTQAELGEKLGVTPITVSRYETGERNIKASAIGDIAEALGVTAGEILPHEEQAEKEVASFTIPLVPVTKKNSQRVVTRLKTGKPMIIPSRRYMEYQHDAGMFLRHRGEAIKGPVNIKAVYYMPTRRRVDLTNLHEALHDVLVHYQVIEDDNSRVVASTDGSRVRYDKENPRTEVVITEVSG